MKNVFYIFAILCMAFYVLSIWASFQIDKLAVLQCHAACGWGCSLFLIITIVIMQMKKNS